jgi:hypothetical protein
MLAGCAAVLGNTVIVSSEQNSGLDRTIAKVNNLTQAEKSMGSDSDRSPRNSDRLNIKRLLHQLLYFQKCCLPMTLP